MSMKGALAKVVAMAAVYGSLSSSDQKVFDEQLSGNRMSFNPYYKPKQTVKVLKEFTIKGKTVMAYSRKDAIKRLRHTK